MSRNRPVSNSKNHLIAQRQEMMASIHQGPLPKPEDFGGYESILPGAADRILKMAEQQSIHRQKLEQSVIIFALILGLSYLFAGMYVTIKGYDWKGIALGIGGLASLVGVFIYGSSQKKRERESKM